MAVVTEGTRAADGAESSASPTRAPLCPRRLPRCRFQATKTDPDTAARFRETPWGRTPGQRAGGGADTLSDRGCLLGGGLGPPCGRSALPAQALGARREAWPSTVWKACLAQVFSSFPMLCSSPCPQNWDTRSGQAF